MNLFKYAVAPDPVWAISLARGDDGYDAMDTTRPYGWIPLPQHGGHGRDLGAWPYVVIYLRRHGPGFDLAEYVEGDVRQWRLPTRDVLDRALHHLAATWAAETSGERA